MTRKIPVGRHNQKESSAIALDARVITIVTITSRDPIIRSMSDRSAPSAILLFAHGARDPRWTEPFEQLRAIVAARAPDATVALAYLEHAQPGLLEAATALATARIDRIRVVPLFFGRGGHLREDFPRQMAQVRQRLPDVRFDVTAAAGEDPSVLEALATFAIDAPTAPLER
jgi:sirohydrochlorin cobaltochelatase